MKVDGAKSQTSRG